MSPIASQHSAHSLHMSAQIWQRDVAWGDALIMNRAAVRHRSAQFIIVLKWVGATCGPPDSRQWVMACWKQLWWHAKQCWMQESYTDFIRTPRIQADFLRVAAALRAEAARASAGRAAAASPPLWPPLLTGALLSGRPRPEPLFLPPPEILLTVAQARCSASSWETPRDA